MRTELATRRPARASFHIVEMGDKELIDALRRGQNSAWTELVDRYIRLVHHVVRKTLSGAAREQDIEDITHDLFQSLVSDDYRVLGTIEPPYDLKAWLAISARRRAIDFARKRKLAAVPLDGSTVAAPEEEPPAEETHAVSASLAVLNPRERQVVQLFYLDGKKYREIAQMTGIPMNSISPTLVRAVEKMQKYLTDRKLL